MKNSDRPPMKHAASVATLLKELFRHRGYNTKIAEHRIFVIWEQIVGKQISARTRPVRIRDGVMHIQVDHAVWMQQLQLLKPQILEKIRHTVPATEIRDLYFRVATNTHQKQHMTAKETTPPRKNFLTKEDLDSIRSTTRDIEDDETRQALTSLLAKQMNLSKEQEEDLDS